MRWKIMLQCETDAVARAPIAYWGGYSRRVNQGTLLQIRIYPFHSGPFDPQVLNTLLASCLRFRQLSV
jgi:hypothetical protein